MTLTPSHHPRPEFRSRLEADVVETFHRESRLGAAAWRFNSPRMRGVSLLLAGLTLGFSTEFASGQVQDARERSQLLEVAQATRQLAALRVRLVEESLKRARAAYEAGVLTNDALLAAEVDFRTVQLQVHRIDLEIAETRASSAPARDELWAPRVGDRDFVSERLTVDASAAQDQLRLAESHLDRVNRSFRAGIVARSAIESAELKVEEARSQLELVAVKLDLRKKFFDESLSSDDVTRRLRRFEVMFELRNVVRALKRAKEMLSAAQERSRAGLESELDAKRAEVEVLELSLRIKSLQAQANLIGPPPR